ncbi:LuxR family transcriptional regulator [Kitasatospora phosalacinea]|nr:LuxR family transcriptional regulator [Kitasatospora phosalacinea]
MPRDRVPRCLRELRLMADDPADDGYARPVPPEVAAFAVTNPLEDELARQQRVLRETRARLADFEAAYVHDRTADRPAITRLTDPKVINTALAAAVAGCRRELLTAQPGGGRPESVLAEAISRDLLALARGVRQRTIYQHTVHTHRPTMSYIEQVTAAGAEVRTQAEIVERLVICDREVAFIPLSDDPAAGALQITEPAMVRFMVRSFEQSWELSVPVGPVDSAPRTPVAASDLQRAILRAVVSGETDHAIARRLGMSRRSVAEHVHKAAVQLGSGSRAQLGYLLATSGLLGPEE